MAMMGTTICAVKRNGKIAIAGDGQVTMGENTIFKNSAKKVRRIFDGKVVIGEISAQGRISIINEKESSNKIINLIALN